MTWLKIYVVDAIQWFPARPSRPSTSSETLLLPSLCAGCQQNIKRSRDVESNEITHLLLSDRALRSRLLFALRLVLSLSPSKTYCLLFIFLWSLVVRQKRTQLTIAFASAGVIHPPPPPVDGAIYVYSICV